MDTGFKITLRVGAGIVAAIFCTAAHADMIQYNMVHEFSGAFDPQGPQPWMTTTIDDGGTPGSVEITLDNLNLVGMEFVGKWYMNLVDEVTIGDLNFSVSSKIGAFLDPLMSASTDTYMADGDGKYDILFDFAPPPGGASALFGVGETVVISVNDGATGTLIAGDFAALSAPAGGHGPFPVAAHVQGISGGESGWVTVPEPASIALLGLGALALLRTRRR